MEGNPQQKKRLPIKRLFGAALGAFVLGSATAELTMPRTGALEASRQFSARDHAERELRESGITRWYRENYRPGISERLARIRPFNYDTSILDEVMRVGEVFVTGNKHGNEEELAELETRYAQTVDDDERLMLRDRIETQRQRMDAWGLYLGLPQRHGTFRVSEFRPTRGTDDIYYLALTTPPEDFLKQVAYMYSGDVPLGDTPDWRQVQSPVRTLVELLRDSEGNAMVVENNFVYCMGKFTLSLGEDERGTYVSYRDLWNLGGSLEGETGFVSRHPPEIYDRIYYDSSTFEILPISSAVRPV